MHPLMEALTLRVAEGLKRSSINCASKWATNYRVMGPPLPGNWTFDSHPWTHQMHDDRSELVVAEKGAQMGVTETALNKAFFHLDIREESVLYVLPASKPDASDFTNARFNPALEMSPHLRAVFSDVSNIGHKRAGFANLYIRGSHSESQLRSVPTPVMFFDEVDVMVQENIPLAFERQSGSSADSRHAMMLSTPTFVKMGIDKYFQESDQKIYVFKCPHCSRQTYLDIPGQSDPLDCLVVTAEHHLDPKIKESYLQCRECHHKLDHNTKRQWLALDNAHWEPTVANATASGYHIGQMYSILLEPYKIADAYLKSFLSVDDEVNFYNSKLGKCHEPKGSRVTQADLDRCKKTSYTNCKDVDHLRNYNCLYTLGADIGLDIHYTIDQWFFDEEVPTSDVNLAANRRTIEIGKCKHFENLDKLMFKYDINFAVIDANPERRKAKEFADRFDGLVKLCFYKVGAKNTKEVVIHSEEEHTITVNRTYWLDIALGRLKAENRATLPGDTPLEFEEHVRALIRTSKKDPDGNAYGVYMKEDKDADHYAHSYSYSEIALPFAVSAFRNEDVRIVL